MKVFDVNYVNGDKIKIKAAAWIHLDDIIELQKDILTQFFSTQGAIGNLLRPNNREFWSIAEKLANLLPVVGSSEKLDLSKIDDIEQIVKIFITTTEDTDGDGWLIPQNNQGLEPSLISIVHGLNFYQLRTEALTKAKNQSEK